MSNENSQPTQIPATSDFEVTAIQPASMAAHNAGTQHANLVLVSPPSFPMLNAASTAAQLNTPLAGSLTSRPQNFYIKATAAQLKAIIQSAPEEVRSRIRSNASKETILGEVLTLRQREALAASQNIQESMDPQEALRKLLTMVSADIHIAVDTSPGEFKKLMEAALEADNTLKPRTVPEERHDLVYTVLTWQVEALKSATTANQEPATQ